MAEFTMDKQFLARVSKASQRAALSSGAIYLDQIADKLTNDPARTGRLYEKRTSRKTGREYMYPISESGTSELGVAISAAAYRRRRRNTRTSKGTLRKRTIRLHRASAPGEPPARFTAALQSRRAARMGGRESHPGGAFDTRVVFGSHVKYARRLEVGDPFGPLRGRSRIEARPVWVPTLIEMWDEMLSHYRSELARG